MEYSSQHLERFVPHEHGEEILVAPLQRGLLPRRAPRSHLVGHETEQLEQVRGRLDAPREEVDGAPEQRQSDLGGGAGDGRAEEQRAHRGAI